MGGVEARVPRGMRDLMPDEMRKRDAVLQRFKRVFRRYGYECIETPALEYWETLSGKYGVEGERLIYRFMDRGGRELGLRYDLTVPLARFIASHPDIPKPFKRYQVQTVWRADKPQRGRYREFCQCDVDIVGSSGVSADAEIIAILYECISSVGVDFSIRTNSRKLIRALVERLGIGVEDELPLARAIDKLERDGLDKVLEEVERLGVKGEALSMLKDFLSTKGTPEEVFASVSSFLGDSSSASSALSELRELFAHLEHYGLDEKKVLLDLSLARGLDYYTGPIYEVSVEGADVGSVGGGGRYDELLGMFVGRRIPATGASIGLDRLMSLLETSSSLDVEEGSADVLICRFSEETEEFEYRLARELRGAGFSVDLYLGDKARKGLRPQLGYAKDKAIPFVLIAGPDEMSKGSVRLKVMRTGEQIEMPASSVVDRLRELTSGG